MNVKILDDVGAAYIQAQGGLHGVVRGTDHMNLRPLAHEDASSIGAGDDARQAP